MKATTKQLYGPEVAAMIRDAADRFAKDFKASPDDTNEAIVNCMRAAMTLGFVAGANYVAVLNLIDRDA